MKNVKSESVKVAVRVRPMNQKEKEEQSILCVEVDSKSNAVSVFAPKEETRTFQFDYVYPIESSQREIYDQVAFPIVESIFQGYNGTIFAYGQTGCGKTFTMMGNSNDPNTMGIIPNAFHHIFGFISSETSNRKFLLRCSFLEIYNEEVRDLLGKDPNKALDVKEDKKKGTYVKDLSYTPLKTPQEISACLDKGNVNKHVGVTSMNAKSSRSHSLFTVYLEIEEGDEKNKKIKSGKLNLVDLAGSERVGKTNATGQTLDEGKKINLSLTALGSVIDALSFNRKFIPYKDSKLTRLLSDSLGGNTKTVMFANVSPASYNYDETLGTLRYASRAKLIKNTPKVNEDPKDALLRQYEEEIKLLKMQLEGRAGLPQSIGEEGKDDGDDNDNDGSNDNDDDDRNNGRNRREDQVEIINDRDQLLEKISLLEKEMISKKTLEVDNNAKQKDNEEKNNQFREYRLQQLKNVDEMERKLQLIQEEKRKEEEALQNDVSKLKAKIKYLRSEIEDLKYDNQKDRTDFLENIKDVNRENSLYKGIIKYLLSETELKRIIEVSKYNEDNDEWRIHPFNFREKNLKLPYVKNHQIPDFIENEHSKREVIISDDHKHKRQASDCSKNSIISESLKKGTNDVLRFEDYGSGINNNSNNKRINNNNNGQMKYNKVTEEQRRYGNNINITNSSSNQSNMKAFSSNPIVGPYKKKKTIDKINIIAKTTEPLPIENGQSSVINNNMMLKKEKERYEEALNYNSRYNANSNRNHNPTVSTTNSTNLAFSNQNQLFRPSKPTKMFLNPISKNPLVNSNNKLELSFKATLEISDNKGNKIEFSPGVNVNLGKRNHLRLGKIAENENDEANNDTKNNLMPMI